MFIRKTSSGYYRGTEQRSGRGQYLALFSWNDYKALDEQRAHCLECRALSAEYAAAIAGVQGIDDPTPAAIEAYKRACTIGRTRCDAHAGIRSGLPVPVYPNGKGKLWAAVRSCALRQCGHFMMGQIRIGGKSITVSGPIGHDGLPLDLQCVPLAQRARLVEVPEHIAAIYWSDNGHNTIGAAGDTLRDWALSLDWEA